MKVLVLATALTLTACASASYERAPFDGSAAMPAMSALPAAFPLIVTKAVPPPANDISEADRRAWFEANRPAAYYVPSQDQPSESDCYDSCHDHGHCGFFGLPISIGLGWSSGCHGGGGFGVGVNLFGLGIGVGIGGW